MANTLTSSAIVQAYCEKTPGSAKLAEEARRCIAGGVTHDSRFYDPHGIYVAKAEGSRKWDVDGNEYVDYAGGHGALLLGHNHPEVVEAVQRQLVLGTHYGSSHELEIRWAELVCQMITSADSVRFTSSGTEATLLALRLARAFTGRPKLVRFVGHFHGWHDHMAFGVGSHFDGSATPGVLGEVASNVRLVPAGDVAATEQAFEHGDVAAVIIEPTGASWGQLPLLKEFLVELRRMTADRDIVLIFDEVITGFRCGPGGAQAIFGVTPDMTTLAKILAGGLPGGAVVGRQEIMNLLDYRAAAASNHEKISHHGTFNANPLSAAAGIKALEIVSNTDVCQRANDYAERLRKALNEVCQHEDTGWTVYGTFSGFHIYTNPDGVDVSNEQLEEGVYDPLVLKARPRPELLMKLRLGMLLHGVEIFVWPGGPTSCVHSEDDLARTVDAFRKTLKLLRLEGEIA